MSARRKVVIQKPKLSATVRTVTTTPSSLSRRSNAARMYRTPVSQSARSRQRDAVPVITVRLSPSKSSVVKPLYRTPVQAQVRQSKLTPSTRRLSTPRPRATVSQHQQGGAGKELWREIPLVRHYIVDRDSPLSQAELRSLYVSNPAREVSYGNERDAIKRLESGAGMRYGADVTTRRKSRLAGAGYGLFTSRPLEAGTVLLFEYIDSTGKSLGRININDRAFDLALLKAWVNVREEDLYQSWRRIVQRYINAIPKKTNLVRIELLDYNLQPVHPSHLGDHDLYRVTKPLRKGAELSVIYTVAVWARLLRDVFPWKASNLQAWRSVYADAFQYATSDGMKREMLQLYNEVSALAAKRGH